MACLISLTKFKSLLLITILLSGCATYQPKPLTDLAVSQAISLSANLDSKPLLLKTALTPESAASIAVILNPTLRIERAKRGLAEAQLIQTKILPNPSSSYAISSPYGANSSGNVKSKSLDLNWGINALLTRSTEIKSAELSVKQSDLEVAWQEWQVAELAKAAIYDIVALKEQLKLWRRVNLDLKDSLETLRKAYNQKNITIIEITAAEASSRNAYSNLLKAKSDLCEQRFALRKALGLDPRFSFTIDKKIKLKDQLLLPKKQELIQLLSDRLDLLAFKKGYESQEEKLRAAVLSQFPKISLGLIATRDSGNYHTRGFGVSIELPIFDRNQGQIVIETATRQQLFDEYINREFEGRSDIEKALNNIEAVALEIKGARAAIPSLKQLEETYKKSLAEGNTDVVSYYLAKSELELKQILIAQLKQKLAKQHIALELATGSTISQLPSEHQVLDNKKGKNL